MGVASSRHSPYSNKLSFDNYDETFKNSKTNDDRTHLMHCIFKEIWKANFLAPVETAFRQGAKVLDIGCGVGTWVNDMASDYQINRVLKPGGWIEVVESELGFISEGPYTRSVVEAICQVMKSRKVNPFIISRHEHLLRSMSGFCNISHRQKNYKIGPRSGKIGELLSLNLCETFKEFLINFDGKVEVMDLPNDPRPMSLGDTYNRTCSFDGCNNSSLHDNRRKPSSGIMHKRKSGFGGRYNRRSGIRRISAFLGGKKNELKVEMIIEKISNEFDLYQSMTLIHRFWAQKANVITHR
ncbi:18159_t:CDS:2 [Acaulospora morrowiae]|uniref:18159_t:CDS:1 n=1 Tax=Acaulospora morrowiae TaxID=94023 RepID=A0A9N8VHG1_9GLOM|nr:18159_t:CDS:2 [Acaulospora morrowiae]